MECTWTLRHIIPQSKSIHYILNRKKRKKRMTSSSSNSSDNDNEKNYNNIELTASIYNIINDIWWCYGCCMCVHSCRGISAAAVMMVFLLVSVFPPIFLLFIYLPGFSTFAFTRSSCRWSWIHTQRHILNYNVY